MRATVLTDRALTKHAGRFVWLSIDTENEKNAAFLETYPWEAVPTFEVLDPRTEKVVYKWLGGVDSRQLVLRFGEAENAMAEGAGRDADDLYARASTLDAQGNSKDAAAAYDEALRNGGNSWSSRGRAAEALVSALSRSDDGEPCARRAIELAPSLSPGISRANIVATGLGCALDADLKLSWRAGAVVSLEASVKEALSFPGLLSDDRAGLRSVLVDARDRQGDAAGAKATANELLQFLEADAKTARSAEARAALDSYRVNAAISAGDPSRALASLEASERDLPLDYNPPARLAIVLRELGRYDEALAASDRALSKVYGPRKLTVLDVRATIFEKKGDLSRAKVTLEQALSYADTLPKPQRPTGTVTRLQERLAAMTK